MHRKLFTLIACGGILACLALRANAAERVFIYGYSPAPAVIYEPAPAVVADADDRFIHAYDVQGVVTTSVPFHMTVRVHDEFYPVVLHQGTIIKPTGITLAPSMIVNVAGYWSGNTFVANRIVVLRY
jgi:hypothetical protein